MSWILIPILVSMICATLGLGAMIFWIVLTYDCLDYERYEKERVKRLKHIIEIMRNPEWKESMKQCMRKRNDQRL